MDNVYLISDKGINMQFPYFFSAGEDAYLRHGRAAL